MIDQLREARRIVVKVGSSLVTDEGRGLDEQAIAEWSRQIGLLVRDALEVGDVPGKAVNAAGRREIVMVSSGAIAEGMKRLGWMARPREVHELQIGRAFV